jgi:hypothetical protein
MNANELNHTDDPFATARAMFEAIVDELGSPRAAGLTHAQLEDLLAERQREVTRQLLQDLLDRKARREARFPEVTGTDGVTRRSAEHGHARWLATRFGRVNVTRIAYRARGASNLHPADAALNLPVEMHSHGLRRAAAEQAVRGSFDTARDQINQSTGAGIGKRQVEALTVRAATDIDAFYTSKVPVPATDDTLLVISADATGVVMRTEALRPATAKAAAAKGANRFATRLAGGEKHGRKRMASLGTVYDANPAVRTPGDVIGPATGEQGAPRRKGPTATAKWLTASIADDAAQVVCRVFDQAQSRDPTHRRCWVVLVDGDRHQLDLIAAEAARRHVTVHTVVDFIHVLEYLWRAAWSFHTPGDPAAEAWVLDHARSILGGDPGGVATAIGTQAAGLGEEGRHTGAEDCVAYLEAKKEYLDYRTALASGWPIATGVIEGACRHLVKDRLDVTGARWGLAGAEAVLKLRALVSNGDFDEYWAWHLEQEYQRVHRSRYRDSYVLAA